MWADIRQAQPEIAMANATLMNSSIAFTTNVPPLQKIIYEYNAKAWFFVALCSRTAEFSVEGGFLKLLSLL